ncbi:MAG: heparinase II/III family protein [Planctomycetes bacterium]|nr:heparinase II/III family protein [Planctomycetota bacterium]MBL7038788.1 heparinase II/III family protein [Pirellulaceae bacterium]
MTVRHSFLTLFSILALSAVPAVADSEAPSPAKPRKALEIPVATAVTDADLFGGLNPEYEPVQPIRQLHAAGKLAEAKRALCNHFRRRSRPTWLFDHRGKPAGFAYLQSGWDRVGPSVRQRGDALLENRLHDDWYPGSFTGLGDGIDWVRAVRAEAPRPTSLSRNVFLRHLAFNYAGTDDERYAAKFAEVLSSWLDTFPIHGPSFQVLQGVGPAAGVKMADEYMNGGYRLLNWFNAIYAGILDSPAISDELLYRWIKAIWYHTAHYQRIAGGKGVGNHHAFERGHCPYVFALLLPEFTEVAGMKERSHQTLMHHLEQSYFDDGSYQEHSVSYTFAASRLMLEAMILADRNGETFATPHLTKRLRRLGQFYLDVTTPAGRHIEIGDHYSLPIDNFLITAVVALHDGQIKRGMRQQGIAVPPMYPAWQAVFDETPEQPVDHTSALYPEGGFAFFRDRWSPDCQYLALSVDTCPVTYHDHQDFLTIQVFAHGRLLLGDPRVDLYHRGNDTKRYRYHNVVMMDGKEPSPRVTATIERWRSDQHFDFFRASHQGFRIAKDGTALDPAVKQPPPGVHSVTCRREVLYVRGRYWIVFDEFETPAGKGHRYDQMFHLHYDVPAATSDDGKRFWTTRSDANLLVLLPKSAELATSLDQTLTGKLALETRKPPVIITSRYESNGPTTMPFLIFPYPGPRAPDIRISSIEVTSNGRILAPNEAVAYEINHAGSRDLLVRARVRPFQMAGKQYDATTLLIVDADSPKQTIFQEPAVDR